MGNIHAWTMWFLPKNIKWEPNFVIYSKYWRNYQFRHWFSLFVFDRKLFLTKSCSNVTKICENNLEPRYIPCSKVNFSVVRLRGQNYQIKRHTMHFEPWNQWFKILVHAGLRPRHLKALFGRFRPNLGALGRRKLRDFFELKMVDIL